jgi:hypothetical protein
MRSFLLDRVGQFLVAHGRQRNLLHNHRVSADCGRDRFGLDLIFREEFRDRARHCPRIHNHGIDDNVWGQGFDAKMCNFNLATLFLQLHSLDA